MEALLAVADEFGCWDILKTQHNDTFKSTRHQNVQNEIGLIQSQQLATKTLMNLRRVERFLKGMEHLEAVLVTLSPQDTPTLMAYIWGPIRYLFKTTHTTEKAMDNVLDVYEQLGCQLIPLYQYKDFFQSVPQGRGCLLHIYQDIITFHRAAYRLFSLPNKLWMRLHRTKWKALRETFKHLAVSLASHGQFIQNNGWPNRNAEATVDDDIQWLNPQIQIEFMDCDPVGAKFDLYRKTLNESRSDFEVQEEGRVRQMKEKVVNWIQASSKTRVLHKKFQDMRICPGTGRWIFKRYSEVNDWIQLQQPPESLLWLSGNRGYGKTVLTSVIVDELQDLCDKTRHSIPKGSKVYYFYCQKEDPEGCTFLNVLKGILHQMIDDTGYLLPLFDDKVVSGGGPTLADAELAKSLIGAILEFNPRQYILIDGIDECEKVEVTQITTFFINQVTRLDSEIEQGRMRVMFISQPMPELFRDELMQEDDASIALKPADIAEDIRAYVKKRTSDFSKPRGTRKGFNLEDTDVAQIEGIVCSRSEDMFLYAHLAIEYLLQQPDKGQLREKIRGKMMPEKLEEIYAELIGALKSELLCLADGEKQWQKSKLLLGWLVCAKRPLKWHEMQAILSYNPIDQTVDFDNRMLRQHIRTYLGSLVHILEGDHIRIIHSTARLYIIQNKHINQQAVKCDLGVLCLRYLCLPCFSPDYDKEVRQQAARLGWFSFQDYACSQWYTHIHTILTDCWSFLGSEDHDLEYQTKLGLALEMFMQTHGHDLVQTLHPDLDKSLAELEHFAKFPFFDSLCLVWNQIYTHQESVDDGVRNLVGIPQIDDALQKNRRIIEENLKPKDRVVLDDTVEEYYGPNLFKCKRTLCKYFYLGYDNKKDRDAHDKRHERPYACPVNCSSAPIGFSTNAARERHVRLYHPELHEGPSIFMGLSRKSTPEKFLCHICGKSFTRKINLKAHVRTHFDDRPYACSNCGKRFVRVNDCRRHEKIHKQKGA